ncbi:phosphatases II [Aspergillus sclerotiicarbonarius CBS 121057]|uniref:protein-tyrosine-phosphatase n=1 Tax=Aspergillus sclerotiicarbonarius (strain CBS 121057 / IBT 28362) TaxID=1448318 RepID=A0A319ESB8_ASPSB|nr:phosphatases II [Aspergillus sclerotiicarbonarius CBS 121057]
MSSSSSTDPKPNANTTGTDAKTKPCYLPRITPIIPGLYLGNLLGSHNTTLLQAHHITAIVSLTTVPHVQIHPDTLAAGIPPSRHQWARVIDSSVQDLLMYMTEICDFIDRMGSPALKACISLPTGNDNSNAVGLDKHHHHDTNNGNGDGNDGDNDNEKEDWGVLVHCDLGRSRSPTIIIAYLMRKFGIGVDEALAFVKSKQKVKPRDGFLRQLKVWEETGYQVWEESDGAEEEGEGGDGGKEKRKGKKVPKEAYKVWLGERKLRLREMGF